MADGVAPVNRPGRWFDMVALSFRAAPGLASWVFVLAAVQALESPARAYGLKLLTDGVAMHDAGSVLTVGAVVAVLAGVTYLASALGNGLAKVNLEERTRLYVERAVLGAVAGLRGIEHHERPEYADRLALIQQRQEALATPANIVSFALSIVVGGASTLALLARMHPVLLLLPLASVPLLVATRKSSALTSAAAKNLAERRRTAALLRNCATRVRGAKELRVYGFRDAVSQQLRHLDAEILHAETKARVRGAAFTALGWVAFGTGLAAALAFVANGVRTGAMAPGDVVLAAALAAQVNALVSSGAACLSRLGEGRRAMGDLRWLLDCARQDRLVLADPSPVPPRLHTGIDLTGVTYRYEGATRDALRIEHLRLPAGTTVAIVGENGSGKSTLIKLICGLLEPQRGSIRVDDIDLRSFDLSAWRERLAVCFQDFVKLECSARESVGVGDLAALADDRRIAGALRRANADEVLRKLRDGLDTHLGTRFPDSVELSGGEWQKVALARAGMRSSPLLRILDEPTASLDPYTERVVMDRYVATTAKEGSSGCVNLLVSHRLSAVRRASWVVVMKDGRVVEQGTHVDLMEREGPYSQMFGRIERCAS